MTLATRAALFIGLMLIMLLALFGAGQVARTSLNDALTYITGPAWDTADGAMETSILIEQEMLLMSELYSRQSIDSNALQTTRKEATDALQRMIDAGLLDTSLTSRISGDLNNFRQSGQQVEETYARFSRLKQAVDESAAELIRLSEIVEDEGDQAMEKLETSGVSISWNTGLEQRWMAADGAMEASIGFYRQLHILEQMISQGTSQKLQDALLDATGFLTNGRDSLVASHYLDIPAPSGFSGNTMAAAYSRLVDEHNQRLRACVTSLSELQQALNRFNQDSEKMLSSLAEVEEQADQKVEGQADALAALRTTTATIILSIMILCVLVLGMAALYLHRRVLSVLNDVASSLHEISEGDGDLRRRIRCDRHDELGSIARSFNRFAEKISVIVQSANQNSAELGNGIKTCHKLSDNLSHEARNTASGSADITGALSQIEISASGIARGAAKVADETHQTETLAGSSKQELTRMISSNLSLQQELEQTSQQILALREQVSGINQLVGVIADISEQTNLLALNAAIEAARAGEQGRGFAVVADEVRNLANRSAESSHQIANVIGEVVASTQSAAQRMSACSASAGAGTAVSQSAGETLNRIVEHMQVINSEVHMVAAAAEEQSTTLKTVSADMQEIARTAQRSSDEAEQLLQINHTLNKLNATLDASMKQFRL